MFAGSWIVLKEDGNSDRFDVAIDKEQVVLQSMLKDRFSWQISIWDLHPWSSPSCDCSGSLLFSRGGQCEGKKAGETLKGKAAFAHFYITPAKGKKSLSSMKSSEFSFCDEVLCFRL